MKKETKEKAALNPVVGATEEQQIQNESKQSIANEMVVGNTKPPEILGVEEDSRTRLAGLEVMSMTELYDSSFPPRVPIIDGLLNCGTYLFVGAPKVGKSFFMA